MELIGLKQDWREVQDIEHAKALIDYGLILGWRDARRLIRNGDQEFCKGLLEHFSARVAEQHETRLFDEVLMEGLMNVLTNAPDESFLQIFLESFLSQPDRESGCFKLAEIALSLELSDVDHEEEVFSTAVTLVCELGLAIKQLDKHYPGEIKNSRAILDHVATYLLSVSNSNNNCIRLSLLNYFGATETGSDYKLGFNKVISRFGHTVLDHLFYLLFRKKTEAVALEFLFENLPFILEGDRHAQTIVHETWKFYMLKNPERFGLFLKTFCDHFKELGVQQTQLSQRPLFQHLGALLRVTSEVNHRQLTKVIMTCFTKFDGNRVRDEVIDRILELPDLRRNAREMLRAIKKSPDSRKIIESTARFSETKRGRKPSFARASGWVTMNQVNFLGNQPSQVKVS